MPGHILPATTQIVISINNANGAISMGANAPIEFHTLVKACSAVLLQASENLTQQMTVQAGQNNGVNNGR
jgi:hypothetical protein